MSLTVKYGQPAPMTNGMIPGIDQDDRHQFQYLAYQHEDGPTWFAGTLRRDSRVAPLVGIAHYIISCVRCLDIPTKGDGEVYAIDQGEFVRLHDKERFVSFIDRQRLTGSVVDRLLGSFSTSFRSNETRHDRRGLALALPPSDSCDGEGRIIPCS